MPTFITPFSGTAELTASTGLTVISQGQWQFSQAGYNDGVTFGVSLGGPDLAAPAAPALVAESGVLELRAQAWHIAGIGNALTAYTDPDTGITYPSDRCRIEITGAWRVQRRPNSNSFNGAGVIYSGRTETDEGLRDMAPFLLDYQTLTARSYRIQGSAVVGGAQDTFSQHVFFCRVRESATTDNTNRLFQSNSVVQPRWIYTYSKSWQID